MRTPSSRYTELIRLFVFVRYSDSDDEAHEKKVAAFPRWAQSPVLTHQLLEQRKINPDDIFGPIPALSIAGESRNSFLVAN